MKAGRSLARLYVMSTHMRDKVSYRTAEGLTEWARHREI